MWLQCNVSPLLQWHMEVQCCYHFSVFPVTDSTQVQLNGAKNPFWKGCLESYGLWYVFQKSGICFCHFQFHLLLVDSSVHNFTNAKEGHCLQYITEQVNMMTWSHTFLTSLSLRWLPTELLPVQIKFDHYLILIGINKKSDVKVLIPM
jgi:hypothetical protein